MNLNLVILARDEKSPLGFECSHPTQLAKFKFKCSKGVTHARFAFSMFDRSNSALE